MRVVTALKTTLPVFFLLICALAWYGIGTYCFIVQRCSYHIDPYFTEELKTAIATTLQEHIVHKPFVHLSLEPIQHTFPAIKTVTAQYRSGGIAQCIVAGYKPLIRINDSHVITEENGIQSSTFFKSELLAALPKINFLDSLEPITAIMQDAHNTNQPTTPYFYSWLQIFPLHLLDMFELTWINHTHITLRDREHETFEMTTYYKTPYNNQLLSAYQHIKKELMNHSAHSERKKNVKSYWNIDVRFKDQIVVNQRR